MFSTQSDVALLDVSKCAENEEDGFHVKGSISLDSVVFIGFVDDYVVLMTDQNKLVCRDVNSPDEDVAEPL